MEMPETRYAWNGDIALAYQVLGEGPVDLVYLQGFFSNVDLNWENRALSRFLRDLARLGRLVITDRRGLGCSERFTPAETPPIESLMDDLAVVLDAVGSDRAVIFASGDCGFIASLFAATYPERVTGLVLSGAAATWLRNDEMPWGWTEERMQKEAVWVRDHLGEGEWMREAAPTVIADQRELAWAGRYERHSLAPGAAYAEILRYAHTDIRSILPTIQAPTLVLHRVGDPLEDIRSGRDLAARIRGARLIELEGSDHYMWAGDQDAVIRAIRNFVASVRREEADLDRVLATVLFTDLVSSTEKAAMLGDRAWAELVQQHHGIVRGLLARYKGIEIETAGDSFFATFDGPARAVRCALAIMDAVAPLGVELRAGVHTGEVKTIAGKPGGLAVNIGARIGALAGPSVLLVSSTVKDLTAGSGLGFEDRGERKLKGVPGSWHIYAVRAS
jgi:pimeloyl-ACP methyl ester carboxylesterase